MLPAVTFFVQTFDTDAAWPKKLLSHKLAGIQTAHSMELTQAQALVGPSDQHQRDLLNMAPLLQGYADGYGFGDQGRGSDFVNTDGGMTSQRSNLSIWVLLG